MIRASARLLASLICVITWMAVNSLLQAQEPSNQQAALAAEFVTNGVKHCGHELSYLGTMLVARYQKPAERAPLESRKLVAELWSKTWMCDQNFISGSCMAARWNLCHRVFEEYGPEGIVIPGLFKPIIHK